MAKQGILFEDEGDFHSLQNVKNYNLKCYNFNILICSDLYTMFNTSHDVYFRFVFRSPIDVEKPINLENLIYLYFYCRKDFVSEIINIYPPFPMFLTLLQKTNLLTPFLLVKFDKLLEQNIEVKYEGLFVSSNITGNIPYIRFNFGTSYNLPVFDLCDACIKEIL